MKNLFNNFKSIICDGVVPPDNVLEGAKGLTQVALCGIDKDGEFFVASSHKCEMALALLERGVKDLRERLE